MIAKSEKEPKKRDLRYWGRLISMGIIGGLIISMIVIEMTFLLALTQPAPSAVGPPPEHDPIREYQSVRFINDQDEIALSGWYLPSENDAVIILLHGYGGNRVHMLSRAEFLVRHGYGVLLYDLRGHGESGGKQRAFGWQDVNDVNSALNYLIDEMDVDPEKIGILGFSIGGQIALRAAAENQNLKAVIADDPGFVTIADGPAPETPAELTTYLISLITSKCISLWTGVPIPSGVPEEIIKISPRPLLLISTGESKGRDLVRNFYLSADQPKQLWEIPEAGHGGQFQTRPEEYEDRVIRFLNHYLLEE
jgi:pimeloyl-ACP methyl ester carboxylesterase